MTIILNIVLLSTFKIDGISICSMVISLLVHMRTAHLSSNVFLWHSKLFEYVVFADLFECNAIEILCLGLVSFVTQD